MAHERAQVAALRHLRECTEWLAYYDEGDPEGERPAGNDPASEPFDGSDEAIVREVLYAGVPVAMEDAEAEAQTAVAAQLARIYPTKVSSRSPGWD